ncbi:MAG: cytochrome c oxidase subunit II [Corynebacteriales bacterium]|nr:cytochrome c oxidase subunit II [Mycobacteriales bacterium]
MLTGCDVEDSLRFGWPRGITPQAEEMRQLWTWSVVAALVVGVFVWGLIFWCIGAYRKRGEELPPQTRYNMPIEILYSAVPFFIISVLFYYTAIAQTYVDKETKNPDVTVTVVAFKWNWRFEYPDTKGADGEEISTLGSTDEIPILVLPTDKTIRFDEISEDVIHSFWVPDLLFKRDVIPGHPNSFQITIEREGAYVGRCAELCGTYHANMNFELRAVSWADYQRYLESRSQGLSMSEALEAIGQPGHATTTEPFNPERTKRSAS